MADPGNSLRQAPAFDLAKGRLKMRDRLESANASDYVQLKIKGRSQLNLKLRGLSADADLALIQDRNRNGQVDAGETIATSTAEGNGSELIQIAGLRRGRYFLEVKVEPGQQTNYQLVANAKKARGIDFAYEVTKLTNAFRQANGLSALAMNTQLSRAALWHSQNMGLQDFFSHTGKDGSQPWDRMRAMGYDYSTAAENIAAGYETAQQVVDAWINSPGHRANMLKSDVIEIGVGLFNMPNDGGTVDYTYYWTQVFGSPR